VEKETAPLDKKGRNCGHFFAISTNYKIRRYLALGFRQHLSFQQGWESEVLLPERARSLVSQSMESSKSGEAKRGMRHIPLASWDNRAGMAETTHGK